ncbi:hypothetical protein P691DRAFT_690951, partial [Macrolepiota fuliginosa MF-IS2]
EKLEWLVNYVSPEVQMDWIQWPEYRTPNWDSFIAKLKKEYSKIHDDRLWGVQALRDLCSKYNSLSLHNIDKFNIFKRKFITITKRCIKNPVLMTNCELVEAFVKALAPASQEHLNMQLSMLGKAGTNRAGVSRPGDPYNLSEVIAKTVNITSYQTLASYFAYPH